MNRYINLSLFFALFTTFIVESAPYSYIGTYQCKYDGAECWNEDEAGKPGVVLYTTDDQWQFMLDPGEEVRINIQCLQDKIKSVNLDMGKHVKCDKNKDDKRNWHYDCTNHDSEYQHHLNVKAFHCGPNHSQSGDGSGGDYDDPAESGE